MLEISQVRTNRKNLFKYVLHGEGHNSLQNLEGSDPLDNPLHMDPGFGDDLGPLTFVLHEL